MFLPEGDRLIEVVAETGSTNADLALRLRSGENLAEGAWLLADRQSGGRGRQGRDWINGEGNFMGSTIVHLASQDENPSCVALVAGLAVYEAVLPHLSTPVKLELKWPNDLMLAGGKLCGILIERHGGSMIVGIGVNLGRAPAVGERKVASLSQLGVAPDRNSFARDLAFHFAQEIAKWRDFGPGLLFSRWLAVAHPVGTPLNVHMADGIPVSGLFAGLSGDGALQLRLPDGAVHVIHAGDVSREGS